MATSGPRWTIPRDFRPTAVSAASAETLAESPLNETCQTQGATAVAPRPIGQLLSPILCAMPDEASQVFSLRIPLPTLLVFWAVGPSALPCAGGSPPPPQRPPPKISRRSECAGNTKLAARGGPRTPVPWQTSSMCQRWQDRRGNSYVPNVHYYDHRKSDNENWRLIPSVLIQADCAQFTI